jgi:hypothetical protein
MYKKRSPVPSFLRRDTQRYILIRYYSIILIFQEVAEVKGFFRHFGGVLLPPLGESYYPLYPLAGESYYPLWGSLITPLNELSTAFEKPIPGLIISSV